MRIGKVLLKNNVMLAPMAGVGDVGFRSVCRMLGAGLSFTEMVSAKGLLYKNAKTERLLATSPHEEPCAVQLFGSEPEVLAEACRDGRLSKFSIIDINMGAYKVFGNGGMLLWGLSLPKDNFRVRQGCRKARHRKAKALTRRRQRRGLRECARANRDGYNPGRLRTQIYGERATGKLSPMWSKP